MSERYVYHAPWEVPPRPTANKNIVGLGALALVRFPAGDGCMDCGSDAPMPSAGMRVPQMYQPTYDPIVRLPGYAAPVAVAAGPGATATVPQPPPTSGGTLLVANPGVLPVSPQPSPTVAAPTPLTLSQPGTTLDSTGASTTTAPAAGSISAVLTDFQNWLAASTTLAGYSVPNYGIAAAVALGAWWMFSGKRGRR